MCIHCNNRECLHSHSATSAYPSNIPARALLEPILSDDRLAMHNHRAELYVKVFMSCGLSKNLGRRCQRAGVSSTNSLDNGTLESTATTRELIANGTIRRIAVSRQLPRRLDEINDNVSKEGYALNVPYVRLSILRLVRQLPTTYFSCKLVCRQCVHFFRVFNLVSLRSVLNCDNKMYVWIGRIGKGVRLFRYMQGYLIYRSSMFKCISLKYKTVHERYTKT